MSRIRSNDLAHPYETNTERDYDDRSSYTAEMFMASRDFTAHERRMAERCKGLLVRFREWRYRTAGTRASYSGELAFDLAEEECERATLVMGAAVKLAHEDGVDFDKIYPAPGGTLEYSNGMLLERLREFAQELGHTPTGAQIEANPDMATRSLYYKRFGTMTNAAKLAGLVPNKKYRAEPSPVPDNQEAA